MFELTHMLIGGDGNDRLLVPEQSVAMRKRWLSMFERARLEIGSRQEGELANWDNLLLLNRDDEKFVRFSAEQKDLGRDLGSNQMWIEFAAIKNRFIQRDIVLSVDI